MIFTLSLTTCRLGVFAICDIPPSRLRPADRISIANAPLCHSDCDQFECLMCTEWCDSTTEARKEPNYEL